MASPAPGLLERERSLMVPVREALSWTAGKDAGSARSPVLQLLHLVEGHRLRGMRAIFATTRLDVGR